MKGQFGSLLVSKKQLQTPIAYPIPTYYTTDLQQLAGLGLAGLAGWLQVLRGYQA
jgi:hypothetical protein